MANERVDNAPTALLPVVAAALINGHGEVLVQQRPVGKAHGGLWEFPGGKIEPGEAPEEALIRELDEELGIRVELAGLVPLAFATAPAGERHLLLLLYVVRRWSGELRPSAADALAWHHPAALRSLPMPPADAPLVAALERRERTSAPIA